MSIMSRISQARKNIVASAEKGIKDWYADSKADAAATKQAQKEYKKAFRDNKIAAAKAQGKKDAKKINFAASSKGGVKGYLQSVKEKQKKRGGMLPMGIKR